MKLSEKYGVEFVDKLTTATNRSVHQTEFLWGLVGEDLNTLLELEEKLKNNFVFACPADQEYVEYVLQMPNDKHLLNLDSFKK